VHVHECNEAVNSCVNRAFSVCPGAAVVGVEDQKGYSKLQFLMGITQILKAYTFRLQLRLANMTLPSRSYASVGLSTF
jgi:hypothetical protein